MICEAKDSQARRLALSHFSARFFEKKALIIGVSCVVDIDRTVACSRRFSSGHFLIGAAGKSLLLSSSSALSIGILRILLLRILYILSCK
jgi:hypothetical protein